MVNTQIPAPAVVVKSSPKSIHRGGGAVLQQNTLHRVREGAFPMSHFALARLGPWQIAPLLSSLNLFHLPSPHRLLGNCNHVRDDHHHRIIAAIVRARERTDDALQGANGDPAIHPELPLTGRAKERFFPAHLHVGRWRTEVHRVTHGPRYLLGTRR